MSRLFPLTEPPADLRDAWPRLDTRALADLLAAHVDSGWQAARNGRYAVGPCPLGISKCNGDPRAAFAYPRADGWAPVIRCHHASCAHEEDARSLLADALGKHRVVDFVRHAACLFVDREHKTRKATPRAQRPPRGKPTHASAPPRPEPTPLEAEMVDRLEAALWSPEGAAARAYLLDVRGLRERTVREFRLGYCAARGAVAIPYRLRDVPVGLKFRHLPGHDTRTRYSRLAGHHHPPFNLDSLEGEYACALVVEGELDVPAAFDLGLRFPTVSLPDGATGSHDELAEALAGFDLVLLGLDSDAKGDEGAFKLTERLGASRCRRVRWPVKDLGECLASRVPLDTLARVVDDAIAGRAQTQGGTP